MTERSMAQRPRFLQVREFTQVGYPSTENRCMHCKKIIGNKQAGPGESEAGRETDRGYKSVDYLSDNH